MGCWGPGSDEDDWSWDGAGFGIMERASGINLTPRGRSAEGLVKSIVDEDGSDTLNHPGVTILLLKLGCPVPLSNLATVRKKLAEENSEEYFPDDPETRRAVVRDELDIIDAAVENSGQVPGPPIGVRPITLSSAVPLPFNLNFRISQLETMYGRIDAAADAPNKRKKGEEDPKTGSARSTSSSHAIEVDTSACANCGSKFFLCSAVDAKPSLIAAGIAKKRITSPIRKPAGSLPQNE
eukprot:CAMPEP_0178648684 /NCGR_PEP_ID=MMETSP0698-20121128/20600_1 /TAXON_ID=265572 /ORGANISM="Extubocellulus spinifer, Strain CCMP396" /LENGTH=237 /DNA_ID=CAMNT_0020290045 /DNA_START=38 /DNA_END=752 /DNA_ORIENTATION=-